MGSATYRFGLLLTVLALGLPASGWAQARRGSPTSIVINELMALNHQTRADPQGQYDDWIELYNEGVPEADLSGCYLTDDLSNPRKWQFPAGTTVAGHGYLLLWADGDVGAAGLHAGFSLSANGGQVALYRADGATLIDSVSFGPQQADVSYGRVPDGGPDWRTSASPTPGAANAVLYEGIVEAPRISFKSGFYPEPITVTLTTATPGATIYFSLNGSDPLTTNPTRSRTEAAVGPIYTAPVTLSRTTTLKALATKPGWKQSTTSTARYVFFGPDMQSFSSPLPIAVIDTYGQTVSTTKVPAFGGFYNLDSTGRARVPGMVDFVGPAAINIRGKSSEGFPKKQYHFETQDGAGRDKKVSILGFPSESDWVLQGQYSDKSLMRNVLPYQWSNEIGQWAAHTRFIEMFLHTGETDVSMNDYVGVYVFMEKIKVGTNRVNVAKLGPTDNAEPEVSGGYIVAKDKIDPTDTTFVTSRGQTLVYKDPNGPHLTQIQKDWIRNYINAFETVLYGPNFADPAEGYARYIDVGSYIDNHIIIELCKNIDGFRLSTYYHKDRGGKLVMGPVWDYDLSLGNANYNDGWNATGWYNVLLSDDSYPYWRRLFQDPEFKLRYADRWYSLRRGLFTTGRLLGIIEGYATLLDEPAARNYARWPTLGIYVWPNWFIAKTYREEITWIEGWLANRLMWMDSQIAVDMAPAPPGFNRQGGPVETGFELTMSSPGPIYYTRDGTDPRTLAGPVGTPASTTVVPVIAAKRVLVPSGPLEDAWRGGGAFDDSAWTTVTGGVGSLGYDQSTRAGTRFSLDLRASMYGQRTSCLVRVPFTYTGSSQNLVGLTLKVTYNDGFVAYLNGVEIARRNFTGTPTWNSAADTPLSVDASESLPIINGAEVLRPGDNLLAVQGLTAAPASTNFLLAVELAVEESAGLPARARLNAYSAPLRLDESTSIHARALIGGRWSALNEAVFAVGPVAQSLRISEIMYHPLETGHPNEPNTEYIELVNIGAEAINLSLVRLTGGITFTFPSYPLPPASCCLAVKDSAAFAAKYGAGLPVAGQYTGSLADLGQQIVLQDAAGRSIHRFALHRGWYNSTDGGGYSLTLNDPFTTDPNALGDKAVWRPSTTLGGSPGRL